MTKDKSNWKEHSRKQVVPNRKTAQRLSNKSFRLLIAFILCGIVSGSNSCNSSHKPSEFVEDLVRNLERGETEKAVTFFSSRLISRLGLIALKQDLTRTTSELKEHGGVKSLKVLSEDEAGAAVQVRVEITRGNGNITRARYTLLKEAGAWKIDAVALDDSEFEPLHSARAVEDVVNWAHNTGAASIKQWLQEKYPPRICNTPPIDPAKLPDAVRYHAVDDPETRERLKSALQPVLTFFGCQNTNGIVVYQGSNIYAGNLNDGQIAITPGGLYFAGSPPDENVFHELAKLRIFLAREIFRQIVTPEPSTAELNNADIALRHELKLNYLAALASLTIDKNPKVLDPAALDIDLYAKPAGALSGTLGIPTLQQIQDIFGAAKQDFNR